MTTESRIAVCPIPQVWMELHRRLCEAAKGTRNASRPPAPLILAGWTYSNDAQKKARWEETLQWADRHGFRSVIGELGEEETYRVAHIYAEEIGPLGGSMYLPWNFDPKPKQSADDREKTMQVLREGWLAIVGPELGTMTRPIRISGAKGRRLVVAVQASTSPPWGSWLTLAPDNRRRTFTKFRAAINHAILPAEIDHIDFVVLS